MADCATPHSYFYPPTLITGAPGVPATDLRIWREEAFGPVLVIVPFDDEQQAISLANDSEYGLGKAHSVAHQRRCIGS